MGHAYRLLVSARVALWLMISWLALLLVWVLPFVITGQSEETIAAIGEQWLPFRIVYLAITVASLLCAAHRFTRDRARDWETALERRIVARQSIETHASHDLETARSLLAANGFSVRKVRAGRVWMTRNRISVHGGAVFHLALPLVALALLVNSATVTSASFELIEGQSVTDSFAKSGSPAEKAPLYDSLSGITLLKVIPRFFGPYLLFERLDATVSDGGAEKGFSLASPLWVDPVTNLSIQDFDVAPRFVVRSPDGEVVEDAAVAMDLFPPGEARPVSLAGAKADLAVRLYTDYEERDGAPVSGSYNIEDVRFLITAVSTVQGVPDEALARRTVAVGEPMTINGFDVSVDELKTVGTFRVTRAPGLPFVWLSLLLGCAGLAARILWRRTDVLVAETAGGVQFAAYQDMFGGAAGEREILRLLHGERESR